MTAGGASTLQLPGTSPDLVATLARDVARVEEFIASAVNADDPFIAEASGHLFQAGGKRFRPMLTVLCAQLGDGANDDVIAAAAAVELTHLASLYHDDVMDEADLRRGAPSANARYDNSTAILVGDLLFGTASSIVADLGAQAVKIQAETFVRLCAGQIRDARPRPAGVEPIDYYLGVLADKTGVLIATAARYGAMFSGCSEETIRVLTEYGERLGVVFQLADDLMDVAAQGTSGKAAGTDLREGVDTLPTLYVRQAADPGDARLLELLDADLRDPGLHAEALALLRAHPAMERAAQRTRDYAHAAQALLDPLGDTDVTRALRALTGSVVDRAV
ncbi:polyprenyl synthetase family protein [Piscicoccus intestinalis]|uniref:polyprenyl synthetase family protein n=1 Tax=Piscicoccus intestinalis TaxID=746033 RepID=UPI000839A0ED|nr:polyprenyl synthetase family protein [Piscicoccus intestinalis]